MEEETEFTKLPVEDRCVHKSWKARVHGYEECTKTFSCIDDEKSPEWNKFLGLIKKFVVDSNIAAQEKGLEAALAYVENAACAGKTVGDVMNGIVNKCVAATKIKTKNNAIQIILMYIEIEKHEAVLKELLKGTDSKNPKVVSACINALTLSLREFGPKIIKPKPLIKKLPAFLKDRDKCVREEGKAMIIEIYRWFRTPIISTLKFKPVQLTELKAEFSKLGNERATPNRYLRSQKPKNTVVLETSGGGSGDVDDEIDTAANDIDPYDLIDPVDILSKLPKDFYDKLEAKKWQERKQAMEVLETLTKNPKLESGHYGELVRALIKTISKDSNVVVVGLAGKCLANLANGLKKKFSPYAGFCLTAILEIFEEKNPNIVAIFREAVDAIFQSQTTDVISDNVIAALENKNPSVKAETAALISRCFAKTQPAVLNKKLLKAYSTALLKTLNEAEPTVRDNSAKALGTAMKLVGEKSMMPFLTDLCPSKMPKIQECAENATTAPAKVEPPKAVIDGVKKVQRPTIITTTTKKPVSKKSSGVATAASKKPQAPKILVERNLSSESVDEIAAETFSSKILSGLGDANWKTRLHPGRNISPPLLQLSSALFVFGPFPEKLLRHEIYVGKINLPLLLCRNNFSAINLMPE